MSTEQVFTETEIDEEALREKYRFERERRLNGAGIEQYVAADGAFAHFYTDPNCVPLSREAVERRADVLIVGCGFGGMLAAVRLWQQGIADICMVDKAGDFGGTWYWNRYPGVACDAESYIYLPLLEETGYIPKQKYSSGSEIFEQCQRIANQYSLYDKALLQTEITELRWLEEQQCWQARTNRGDTLISKFVIVAGGLLHRPKLPGVPGLETFKGHSFHTTRWDYAYTGGDITGGLDRLKDKRVGIIGTGATAVQVVPHLGEWSKHLYVFQRTPSSIDARNNVATDPAWAASLKPGWQRERMENFTSIISGRPVEVDLVNDAWTDLISTVLLAARKREEAGEVVSDRGALIQQADYRKMDRVRARIDQIVEDPDVAEALKPWYNQFCKRPCFHDQYLQTFNRPNVTLVDTNGRGVERITERGAVVGGKAYELDCLIYSTGFDWSTDFTHRVGFEIYGRGGHTLTEKWMDGSETLHGLTTRGFPNSFYMTNVQSGQSANNQHVIEEQARHISYIISEVNARKARTVEPTAAAEAEWTNTIVEQTRKRAPFLNECTPGYINNEGDVTLKAAKNGQFWRGPMVFFKLLEDWRSAGDLAGLELQD